MNSDMVKPEKFGHLHLVYHFTVPLNPRIPTAYWYLDGILTNKNTI